ncbi:hypothetical protein, partial [Mesorhizobium sp. M7A.F.Ca.CA.002.03.1.1]|uniref:hypothetical protein n=1 Tax=Mesorhizobium sp. M7A.F.Ca.CA.002.03.1.1 TaxID=2496679 RepID=UPI0019D1A6D1
MEVGCIEARWGIVVARHPRGAGTGIFVAAGGSLFAFPRGNCLANTSSDRCPRGQQAGTYDMTLFRKNLIDGEWVGDAGSRNINP